MSLLGSFGVARLRGQSAGGFEQRARHAQDGGQGGDDGGAHAGRRAQAGLELVHVVAHLPLGAAHAQRLAQPADERGTGGVRALA